MKIISWNVNGIRAAARKNMFDYLQNSDAEIVCMQETKAQKEQLDDSFINPPSYTSFWSSAEKKGYSGVMVYTKRDPNHVSLLDNPAFDSEGRGLVLEFDTFVLINCYFPNSQVKGARLAYKLSFCHHILSLCDRFVADKKNVILCGDYNIAHKPIDLARPKDNEKNAGYLPEERAWLDTFVDAGYVDTFRAFNQEAGQYTWWSARGAARENNVGWRIDYFFVHQSFLSKVTQAAIHADISGSDHCPISLQVQV